MREKPVPLISVVVPCFNEEQVLPLTHRRLTAVLHAICTEYRRRAELIYVNDGSSDGTQLILDDLLSTAQDGLLCVRSISFSRNFGHQAAVTAGMDAALGETIVLIDADLQDPPELISEMLRHYGEGYEVVYAVRHSRAGESDFKLITASLFYRFLNLLSDTAIPRDTGDFRLISRRVADVMLALPERERFLRGMIAWVGFKQYALPYERDKRAAGDSKYPLRKMLSFALTGILSFSVKPLRLSSLLGLCSASLALVGIIYALVLRLFTDNWVTGWTLLLIAILFLGGVQLICLGIVGEYVGRTYTGEKQRPLYIVSGYQGYHEGESPRFTRSPIVPLIPWETALQHEPEAETVTEQGGKT